MRRLAQLLLLFSGLLLVSGCQSFDPTRLWKLNRGEDYMNNDQYFSIPAQKLSSTPPTPEADRPEYAPAAASLAWEKCRDSTSS